MKFTATTLLALTAYATATPLCTAAREKCDAVEPSKFLGDWFEIGRTFIISNTFQRGCDCVEAKYRALPNTRDIQVTNTCVRNGEPTQIVGSATPLSNSELKVTFAPEGPLGGIATFFQNLADGPNYVIKNVWTDAQGNYERALIVAPQRRIPFGNRLESIWILARSTQVTDAQIKETLDYARAAGFNPDASRWERTEQQTCRSAVSQ
jgi:lipocalin